MDAGLTDPDQELALDSIRMLGNMRQLRNIALLKAQVDTANPLRAVYVYQALLRLHDYSEMPVVADILAAFKEDLPGFALPRGRLAEKQFELADELSWIRAPAALC